MTEVDGLYVHNVGTKPIIFIMHVIEYQHRGLPHAHIVYRIHDPPGKVVRGDTDDVIESKHIDQA